MIGVFGAAVTSLLAAFPKELVAAIAGLDLLGTIGAGVAAAVKDEVHREAVLITFLVTLSGVVICWHWLSALGRGGRRTGAVCTTIQTRQNFQFLENHHANSFRRRPA